MKAENKYTSIAGVRIALGGFRERTSLRFRTWQTRPQIIRAAAPTLAKLREIKTTLPAERPLIGILLAEHLGDVVACEPVISLLKNRNPDACMVWMTKPIYHSLVASHPAIDAVIALNSVSEAKAVITKGCLDQAYDLQLPGKPCDRFGLSYTKVSGDLALTMDNYFNYGALLTAMSRSAGLPNLDASPRLYIGSSTPRKIDALSLPRRYIAIHAHSNQRLKDWEDSRWPRLVEKLRKECGTAVVEVGLKSVLPPGDEGAINLCGRLSPIESAEVIRRAELFIGVDSGPAHCANALEVPSVILLGQYKSFVRYMPYTGYFRENESEMLLRSDTRVADLPVEAVFSRVQRVRQRTRQFPAAEDVGAVGLARSQSFEYRGSK